MFPSRHSSQPRRAIRLNAPLFKVRRELLRDLFDLGIVTIAARAIAIPVRAIAGAHQGVPGMFVLCQHVGEPRDGCLALGGFGRDGVQFGAGALGAVALAGSVTEACGSVRERVWKDATPAVG